MLKRDLPVFIGIAIVFWFMSGRFGGFIQDDAYIFARYANNLAQGNGFVYNNGERVEGATSLLWTFIAAAAAKTGTDVPHFLQLAGTLSAVLWLFVFFLICRQWLKTRYTWIYPLLLLAFFPAMWLWSKGGLEVMFFGLLMYTALYAAEAWRESGKNTLLGLAILASVLLVFTRPEGLTIAFFTALYLLIYPNEGKRKTVIRYFIPLVGFSVVALIAFRFWYFNDIVPNTYYAKGGGGYYLLRLGLGKLSVMLRSNWIIAFVVLSFAALSIKSRLRIWLLLIPVWIAYFVKVGGDILPENRLFLPAVPLLFLGSFFFWEKMKERYFPQSRLAPYLPILISGLFVVNSYRYSMRELSPYFGVKTALEGAHGETGRYLNTHMKPGETAVLTDAGMTAYYAPDKHMTDWLGLCSADIARVFFETGYNPWAMYYCTDPIELEKRKGACYSRLESYFEARSPEYVVLNIYLSSDSLENQFMEDYAQNLPDSLGSFVINHISFEGYFGIFNNANNGRGYKPVLAVPYNPEFWMITAKK